MAVSQRAICCQIVNHEYRHIGRPVTLPISSDSTVINYLLFLRKEASLEDVAVSRLELWKLANPIAYGASDLNLVIPDHAQELIIDGCKMFLYWDADLEFPPGCVHVVLVVKPMRSGMYALLFTSIYVICLLFNRTV